MNNKNSNSKVVKKIGSRRKSVRVNVSFTLLFSQISEDEYENTKKTYIAHKTSDREGFIPSSLDDISYEAISRDIGRDIDPAIARMWISIERRLDFIISMLSSQGKEDIHAREAICTDICSEGVGFVFPEALEAGSLLKIRIFLPISPPMLIVCIGKILRTELKEDNSQKKGFKVAVTFIAMNEDDRDKLVSYIFKRQRELLRYNKIIKGGGQ